MTSWKLYNALLLSLSLTLTGCGSDDDDTETTTPETTTPEVVPLSVANPIADIELVANTALDFSIPTDTCTAAEDVTVSQLITSVTDNVGFGITNFTAMSGFATEIGVVSVTVTCSAGTEEVTDEFTITVVDFEADPIVEATAPSTSKSAELVTLTAVASDQNLSGSIVSYSWVETSALDIALTSADTSIATFTVPDTTTQTTATFQVTVTDNDGATATDTVDIDLISTLSPDVSLSFPLALGEYSSDAVDMFGNVQIATGDSIASVVVTVDDIEHTATVTGDTWRVADVTLTETTDIKIQATSTNGLLNFEEVNLVNNDVYATTIDNDIVDIAVDESTDEIYVQLSGGVVSDIKLQKFNLITSSDNSTLTVTQPTDFLYTTKSPTGVTFDSTSGDLFVSYGAAVTKIDLETGAQSVLSDLLEGEGTDLGLVTDLHYDSASDSLYVADINIGRVMEINKTSGDRTTKQAAGSVLSITINSVTSDLYIVQRASLGESAPITQISSTGTITSLIYVTADAPVSDLTMDEAGNELFFVDATGNLIKLDLIAETQTTLISGLFSVGSIDGDTSPMIGLHYHSERNVLIAVGADADGTNKLLVIDPVSGDYAKVATGE